MNKKKMVIRLSLVLCLLIALYFEMSAWAPHRVGVRTVHLVSSEIPESFDNVSIAVISDINSAIENLTKAKKHYNNMNPDVLIFTGDLFETSVDDDLYQRMGEILKAMNAPLGKFAILSPNDIESSRQLLVDSGFTILSNSSFRLHNNSTEAIQVNFYDSNTPANASKTESYAVGFAYDANTFETIKEDTLDVFVGGKTLAGAINLPFIGSLTQEGHTKGSSVHDGTRVIVSHGLGTPGQDLRLLSSPELLLLTFEHENVVPVETPPVETPEETPSEPITEPPSEEAADDES